MNLLKETEQKLSDMGKAWTDVEWIGGKDFTISVENFKEIAKATDYDSGYGSQAIARDLVIVGNGWWLEREEYDGSEWWTFMTQPTRPRTEKTVKSLGNNETMWETLETINREF